MFENCFLSEITSGPINGCMCATVCVFMNVFAGDQGTSHTGHGTPVLSDAFV